MSFPMDPTVPPPQAELGPVAPDPLALPTEGDMIARDKPEPSESRSALVEQMTASVKAAKGKWAGVFKRMREDMNFAFGRQWPGTPTVAGAEDERYVANIVQRHIQQRTAVLYAKNPKAIAKRRERIDYTVWDGTNEQLMQAEQAAQQAAMMGQPPDPSFLMVMQDHAEVMAKRKLTERIGRTLEIVYQHYIDEQVHAFKAEMKRAVRRTITCGVSYVKLGYQRVMEKSPDVERQIADFQMQLAVLQTKAADIADDKSDPDSAEAERLRLALAALQQQPEVLVREGLTFDFPAATAIIPDTRCRSLLTFAGCEWVAEEYLLSADEVKAIYRRDVTGSYTAYTEQHQASDPVSEALATLHGTVDNKGGKRDVLLWLVYHARDGLVYTLADGYCDFLEEPRAPDFQLERFYPWFALVFNELEHEDEVFPVSDVRLMRHQQQEYNRSREGLREHRQANRPMTVTANGTLDDEDRSKLQSRPANAVVELNGLQPGQDIKQVLQAYQGPTLDPNLYEPAPVFQDVLRVVGTQEANLGGTSNATATESSIAEGSRMSGLESNVDELDDLLTELARNAAQVLLQMLDPTTAKEIAGEGAAWPELNRREIANELMLEVEAGSSGRPNKNQDIANMERLAPFLLQMPGISQEWLAREMVRRMDDRVDLTEAVQAGQASAMAMNAMAQGGGVPGMGGGAAAPGGTPPEQAGGAENVPNVAESQNQAPRPGRPPMRPQNPNVALAAG
jgi:hypothetical protein